MPATPRTKKLQKILNQILGTPAPFIKVKLSAEQERIKRLLNTQANRMLK